MECHRQILEYVQNMSELTNILLENLDKSPTNSILIIKTSLQSSRIFENRCKMREFLWILSHISKNHCHVSHFLGKVEELLTSMESEIKQICCPQDLINIGKTNKLFLLFFLEHNLLSFELFSKQDFMKSEPFISFFSYELKHLAATNQVCVGQTNTFIQNRKLGENDSEICIIIRLDLSDSFIPLYTQLKYSPDTIIPYSIYETNEELDKITGNRLTIIEYAAFFGSSNIFKYLFLQKPSLPENLWKCAIHGRNYEIIHLLEESQPIPPSNSYKTLLMEAIKCHNNELADYLIYKYFQNELEPIQLDYEIMETIIQSHNYPMMLDWLENNFVFTNKLLIDLCKFSYYHIVAILLKSQDIDVNYQQIIILNTSLKSNAIILIIFP